MMKTSKMQWYWHRLRAMDTSEIAGRVVEKARNWSDRGFVEQIAEFRLGLPRPLKMPERSRAPEQLKTGLAKQSEGLCLGHWPLFGGASVEVGDPPHWHRDPLAAVEVPHSAPSTQLDHRDLKGGADSRVIWELNRWSEPMTLAQNAWLNGNLEDARTVQRWLWDWCDQNPTGQGLNWCSPLEVALRLIHFTWIDVLLHDCEDAEVRDAQLKLAQRVVPSHCGWIWRHRSFGSSANNHLIGELTALIVSGSRWTSLAPIACCPERAWQLLEEEILTQFLPDGGNREQALHYHLFALQLVLQASHWLRPFSGEVAKRVVAACRFFTALSPAEGGWDFGDSDDAVIAPISQDPHSSREWHDYLRGEEDNAIAFWFGPSLVSGPAEEADSAPHWQVFEHSGQATFQSRSLRIRLDASPLGFGSMAAHGHLDALHASLWIDGQAVLIDPGTGAYYGDPELRAELASWEAHNGPLPVSGREFPKRSGPFLWSHHHHPPQLERVEGDAVARFACDGPFVTRRVLATEERVQILDEISTDTAHVVHWQLAPGWTVNARRPSLFELHHASGLSLKLELDGGTNPIGGEVTERRVSPRFRFTEPAPCIRVSFKNALRTQLTRL